MEGDKIDVVFPVIADTDWECAALLCDDTGIPRSGEKRLEVFAATMERAKEFNIDPSRLHIDPLVEMLCTSEDGINMLLAVIREIKSQYPTIHVTAGGKSPIHVALLQIDGRRVFARLDHAPREDEMPEEVLAGQKVKLLVKGDGDAYFQIPRGRGLDLGRLVKTIRRRVGGESEP